VWQVEAKSEIASKEMVPAGAISSTSKNVDLFTYFCSIKRAELS
jgi:hypothetical protein